jgi:hypothetical protein
VVGYALTDVPERVLEIYGIPQDDLDAVKEILGRLHEQKEYEELKKCCKGSREDDEELLPAMQYKTFLRDFVLARKAEFDLVAKKKRAENELENHQKDLDALARQRVALIQKSTQLQQAILSLASEIEAETGRSQADGGVDGTVGAQSSSADLEEKKKKLEAQKLQLRKVTDELAALPAKQAALEVLWGQKNAEVEQAKRQIQDEQDPGRRERKFADLRIPAYFLNVTIKVKHESLKDFTDGMRVLLEDFKWDFIAAGQLPPGHRPPQRGPSEDEIMHLWKFGDANNLYQQMVELRENQRFADLERFTNEQIHMLMCDWEVLSNTQRLAPPFPVQ